MTETMWTPPDNPDPSAILNSAVDDKRSGQYAQAVEKHRWFHQNAIQYERGLSGVRLSFALSFWLELAADYPAAKDAFVETRDAAETSFQQKPSFDLFCDLAALNYYLGESVRSADLFVEVAERDPECARQFYYVAEQHLVVNGRITECAPFLEVEERLKIASECYGVSKQAEDAMPEQDVPNHNFARQDFVDETATLVALLVLNHRKDEGQKACDIALNVIKDDEFQEVLEAAMTGKLPGQLDR